MTNFSKIVRIGTIPHGRVKVSVYVKAEFKNGKLSISGVEGPTRGGNAVGCGQISMHMDDAYLSSLNLAPSWTRGKVRQLLDIWNRWHLNDMRAGTPEQMVILDQHKAEFPGYPVSYYDWARDTLKAHDLYEHNGYRYGSAWLSEQVPQEVLSFLQSLPDTDKQPAWV